MALSPNEERSPAEMSRWGSSAHPLRPVFVMSRTLRKTLQEMVQISGLISESILQRVSMPANDGCLSSMKFRASITFWTARKARLRLTDHSPPVVRFRASVLHIEIYLHALRPRSA
jgi:hypothetical protein